MAEQTIERKIRHRGRLEQVRIYLGKFLRMFVYQNEWKVFPMAILISALVALVVRRDFFVTMEGTLKGSFALVCVAIWNGCFNSIQVICRERDVIKREHRSGMHISSYIMSHMLYQAILCMVQAALTLFVFIRMGVKIPAAGLIINSMTVELGISIFLITYASDMMALWFSAISRSTTTAMTIMPFVLIFQLVFSGGFFTNLPSWSRAFTKITISNYGLKCINAQADFNNLPSATVWNAVNNMRNNEIGGTITVGRIVEILENKDSSVMKELRDKPVSISASVGDLYSKFRESDSYQEVRNRTIEAKISLGEILGVLETSNSFEALRKKDLYFFTVGDLLYALNESVKDTSLAAYQFGKSVTLGEVFDLIDLDSRMEQLKDVTLVKVDTTVGEIIDTVSKNFLVQGNLDKEFKVNLTLGKLIDLVGEEKVKSVIQTRTAESMKKEAYASTQANVEKYWVIFLVFSIVCASMATICLEFIDKDKR